MSTTNNKFKVFHSYTPIAQPKVVSEGTPTKNPIAKNNIQMKPTSNVNTRPLLIAKPTSGTISSVNLPPIPINPPKVTKTDTESSHSSTSNNVNRGNLPKSSVEVLRKWLFAHFDHPYPNDADKEKLMKETTLSLTQVNNWFINARRRIWKPFKDSKAEKSVKQENVNLKVPISVKHDEERPEKRKKIEEDRSDEEFDLNDEDYEVEDEIQRIERVQRENHILKEELKRLSSSYHQLLTDFSQRNEDLIKQLSNLETLYRHLENANIEMSKKVSESYTDKELIRPVCHRPPFHKTMFKDYKPMVNTLPNFEEKVDIVNNVENVNDDVNTNVNEIQGESSKTE